MKRPLPFEIGIQSAMQAQDLSLDHRHLHKSPAKWDCNCAGQGGWRQGDHWSSMPRAPSRKSASDSVTDEHRLNWDQEENWRADDPTPGYSAPLVEQQLGFFTPTQPILGNLPHCSPTSLLFCFLCSHLTPHLIIYYFRESGQITNDYDCIC